MSGGGGGRGGGYAAPPPIQPFQLQQPPMPEWQPAQGPQFGPTATPNPFTAEGKPPWMQGWFDMPTWGQDVMGNPLTQQSFAPPVFEAPAPQQEPEEQGPDPMQQAAQAFQDQYLNPERWRQQNMQAGARGGPSGPPQWWQPQRQLDWAMGREAQDRLEQTQRHRRYGTVGGRDGG